LTSLVLYIKKQRNWRWPRKFKSGRICRKKRGEMMRMTSLNLGFVGFLMALSTLVAASNSFADVSKIRCDVNVPEGKKKVKKDWIEFLVSDLGTKDAFLFNPNEESSDPSEGGPIKFKKDGAFSSMNDQGGDLRVSDDGDIELYGDGDGYVQTYLFLYKDSGFKFGYAKEAGSIPNWYTKDVKCKVTKLK
jgi:hypothetical protein